LRRWRTVLDGARKKERGERRENREDVFLLLK